MKIHLTTLKQLLISSVLLTSFVTKAQIDGGRPIRPEIPKPIKEDCKPNLPAKWDSKTGEFLYTECDITKVGIGIKNPSEKLEVIGNIKATGSVMASGDIASKKIITTRITSPNGIIAFGDSTIYFNHLLNRIYWTSTAASPKGLAIGSGALATGLNALAFGPDARATADNSVAIGFGYGTSAMNNAHPNSLMVSFNTTTPTFFVGPGNNLISGNVGIGTASPAEKLDVLGTAQFLTGAHRFYIKEGSADPDKTIAGIRNNSGNVVFNSKNSGVLYLNRDVNADVLIQSNNGGTTREIAAFKSNGNVGIGTTTPQSALDVKGWISLGGGVAGSYGAASNAASGSGGIYFPSTDNDWIRLTSKHNGVDNSQLVIYTGDNDGDGIVFTNYDITKATERDYLTINRTTMAYCGSIHASEVIVENRWCDFVFKSDYKLPSLSERKEFIRQYGHLPYIQSEKEVSEKGANLGKAVAGILQNTEELTLYLIELNERLEKLEKENRALKSQIQISDNK